MQNHQLKVNKLMSLSKLSDKKLSTSAYSSGLIGLVLILTLLFTYVFGWVWMWLGLGINRVIFPLSVLCSSIVSGLFFRHNKASILEIAAAVLIILLCVMGTGLTDDYSFDGNTYHQEIIIYFLDGWNPIERYVPTEECSPWSIHYAKGLELAASCIASTTGSIETGKAANLFLILGTGFLSFFYVSSKFRQLSNVSKYLIVLVVTLNVVGMAQVLTFYNDYAIYFLGVLTIICSAIYTETCDKKWLFLLSGLIILGAGIKFTVFFYQGLTGLFVIIWIACLKRYRNAFNITLSLLAGCILGAIIFGYNPYVTNTFAGGNPFYPLIGSNETDIMGINTPDIFQSHGRIYNFFKSLASISFPKYGERIGGFGPLMPLMLLLSLVNVGGYTYGHKNGPARKYIWLYISAASILSCFCFEQTWWARYINIIWLVIVSGVISGIVSKNKYLKISGYSVGIMAIISGTIAFAGGVWQGRKYQQMREAIYDQVDKEAYILDCWISTERHFKEHGIRTIEIYEIPEDSTLRAVPFFGTGDEPGTPIAVIKK